MWVARAFLPAIFQAVRLENILQINWRAGTPASPVPSKYSTQSMKSQSTKQKRGRCDGNTVYSIIHPQTRLGVL